MNDEKTNRGMLLPNEQALEYFRKNFVMSAKAEGRIGQFYQVHDFKTHGTDKEFIYDDPVDVAYHLDTTPSRKLLTKYGWFVEDQAGLPILLYLTYYDINNNSIKIDEGARISISGKRTISANDIQTELFQIVELHTDLELNQCVCKVVPVREKQTENVKVLATEKDPVLENVYLNREIYYTEETGDTDEDNKFISRN
jgi:hypothetical protein